MADIASVVLQSLIDLIIKEANLLSEAKIKVVLLRDNLGVMKAFLKDSAGKQHSNNVVKEIVDQISKIALEAEDVIDTYMANKIMKQRRKNLWSKSVDLPRHTKTVRDVATETEKIMLKIKEIYAKIETYGINKAESSADAAAASAVATKAGQRLQKMRRKVEEDDVVGFVHDTEELVSQLTDHTKNLKRDVVSIVGDGGLGKTTLAKKIYNHTHVKNHFDCCAWVNVSQEYKYRNLLLDILKCLKVPNFDKMYKRDDEDLRKLLCEYLEGKKCFVVMDDIWVTDVWKEMKDAFPNDSNGRILITSRDKKVALDASPTTKPHYLKPLNDDESWELLCKKVFQGEECPSDLKPLGKELAKGCKGLPLSLVVLGGILAKKDKSTQIWSKFKNCVTSYLTDKRISPCSEILGLSYDALPLELKPCFLYLGMFPEDYEIRTRDLIRLWISERLVHQIGNRKVDDVAEDYLEELIDRSLIQVSGSDGSAETCRIHDLLRGLCIEKSGEQRFFHVHSEANNLRSSSSSSSSSPTKPRRLSVNCRHSTQYMIPQNPCDISSSRSLFFFSQGGDFLEEQWNWMREGFKFFRVLRIFNDGWTSSIPKGIGKSVFLRHLSITSYGIGNISTPGDRVQDLTCGRDTHNIFRDGKVPDYICSLPYLETLELQQVGSHLSFSQKSLSEMKQLRYLDVGAFIISVDDDDRRKRGRNSVEMDILPNLQSVHSMVVRDRHTASLLPKFPNLTELTLVDMEVSAVSDVEQALASVEKNLQYLQSLYLYRLRDCNLKVVSLTKVTLNGSAGQKMMETLKKLPNLLQLQIKHVVWQKSVNLSVGAGEFPKLEVLELIESSIDNWEIMSDGMRSLRRLVIISNRFSGKVQVPNGLWLLRDLEFVKIEMDTKVSANSIRNKLRELNYVKKEIIHQLESKWELTLENGCKVSLSFLEVHDQFPN